MVTHKSVTGDNKYAVDSFGKKTVSKSFTPLSSAKAYANKEAKRQKLKSFGYHDAYETIKQIKVKDAISKKKVKRSKPQGFGFNFAAL